jgi:crossover junction endodeoxyribonuclease RuvC
MKVCGIDPGIRGGLSIVLIESGKAPVLIDAIDIPVIGYAAKERIDALAVVKWIERYAPQHAGVERGQAYPRQGLSSAFKFGRAVGALEAAVACCHVAVTIVEPSRWKKFHCLPRGAEKEASRQRALELFPSGHRLLDLKKHHGRAESALIAAYVGRMLVHREHIADAASEVIVGAEGALR